MLHNRHFWLANNIGLSLYYLLAVFFLWQGAAWDHIFVMIGWILLLIHILEMPFAYAVLRDKNPELPRMLLLTLLFGFTWWLPAKLGVYSVSKS